jgi:hypothetical protein
MGITIPPRLETELRARAEAEGITVEAYLERLVRADEQATDELARLAHEGLSSGELIEAGPDYWHEKHRRLEANLKARV